MPLYFSTPLIAKQEINKNNKFVSFVNDAIKIEIKLIEILVLFQNNSFLTSMVSMILRINVFLFLFFKLKNLNNFKSKPILCKSLYISLSWLL